MATTHGLAAVSRVLNVAGAYGRFGEPERHRDDLSDRPAGRPRPAGRVQVEIYGEDYPTPTAGVSGTYIKVTDLADAHCWRCGTRSPAEHGSTPGQSGTG